MTDTNRMVMFEGESIPIDSIIFITPETVEQMEIPPFAELNKEYLNNNGPKYAEEKLLYLRSMGLDIPEEWASPEHIKNTVVSQDFISCINRAYIFANYVRMFGIWKSMKQGELITPEEFAGSIESLNSLLRLQIDDESVGWRKKIAPGSNRTFEGIVRVGGGVANIGNKVSVTEMHQIVGMFMKRFLKK